MLTLCAAALALAVEASPAEARFTFQGKVLDATRAPIAAAKVTAVPDARGTRASTRTDAQGEFRLDLRGGSYTIRIVAPGFLEEAQPVSAIAAGAESREFILTVAGVRETVTVTAPPGYQVQAISSATRTLTPLRDVPQSVTVATRQLILDQQMTSMADVVRYLPGIGTHQGENNRDQVVIRGNNSSADFFLDGVRDDVQYYRDLYNLERVEALKGPNAMTFGRGGGGGVINRVTKEAGFQPVHEVSLQGGTYGRKRVAADIDQPLGTRLAFRLNGMYESSDSFRDRVDLERYAVNPTLTFAASDRTKLTFGYEHLHDRRVADRGLSSFGGLPVDASTWPPSSATPTTATSGPTSTSPPRPWSTMRASVTIRNRTLFGDYDRFYQNYVPAPSPRTRAASPSAPTTTRRRAGTCSTRRTSRMRSPPAPSATPCSRARRSAASSPTTSATRASSAPPRPSPSPWLRPPSTPRSPSGRTRPMPTTTCARTSPPPMPRTRSSSRPRSRCWPECASTGFDLQYHNNRNGDTLDRVDDLVSPRAGVVFKPATPVSVYGSYSVSYLPSSGDQFSSLTTVTQQVEPEKFQNYEAGVKWDVRPDLS